MPRSGFYIIRCPKCGRYTYAPTSQKTRLCVYCQRIFKINPLNAIFIEDAKTARTRVQLYQTGKHHQEFMAAVEKARAHIRPLIPQEQVELNQIQEKKVSHQPTSTRRRELEQILYQHARKKTRDLQDLEQECQKAGIPWDWTVRQIEGLISSGHLISPKPWQIRLVGDKAKSNEMVASRMSPTKLARKIADIIRNSSTPINHTQLLEQLENESISEVDSEEALELLQGQGYVIKTPKGTYQWTGD
ncbi:MAG: hypothetical protein ACFFDE_09390 [Promethearchaeota archaeon]